jgi:hypothetical protein
MCYLFLTKEYVKEEELDEEEYVEQEPEVMVKVETEDNIISKEHVEPLNQEYLLEHPR